MSAIVILVSRPRDAYRSSVAEGMHGTAFDLYRARSLRMHARACTRGDAGEKNPAENEI